jgi:hypothetical protein
MTGRESPLGRVRRAKTEQSKEPPASRIDGGALAVGLVVALGAQVVAALALLLDVPTSVVRPVALASTLVVPYGSYLAGMYAGAGAARNASRGALHGGVVAAAVVPTTVLAGLAVVEGDSMRAVADVLLGGMGGPTLFAGVAVALAVVGAVAGAAGRA